LNIDSWKVEKKHNEYHPRPPINLREINPERSPLHTREDKLNRESTLSVIPEIFYRGSTNFLDSRLIRAGMTLERSKLKKLVMENRKRLPGG